MAMGKVRKDSKRISSKAERKAHKEQRQKRQNKANRHPVMA